MVTLTFQQPDFNPERNPDTRGAWDEGVSLEVAGFDLDFSTLTVYPRGETEPDLNLTLANRAPYQNEEGVECGDIGWVIQPDDALLAKMPEIRQHSGKRYGRVLVFASDNG